MSDGMPASIASALVKAQREARDVVKDGENKYHRYAYATADAIASEARRALNKSGLALCRVGWSVQKAGDGVPLTVLVTYALVHDDGSSCLLPPAECPVIPEKGRPEDKATAAALTFSAGYVALGLLQIERVNEHSPDARDEPEPEPSRPKVSVVPVSAMLDSFAGVKAGETAKLEKLLARAREVRDGLNDEDDAKVSAAIREAKARAEQKPEASKTAKPGGTLGVKATPLDCTSVPELSLWVGHHRDRIAAMGENDKALTRAALKRAADKLQIDADAMLVAAGLGL
jgi:hypothetical protein